MHGYRLLRWGLAYLAINAGVVGVWAWAAPRSFFDSFPGGPAAPWIAALPPYNEHLVRDVGTLYVAFTLLFLWAAARPSPHLVVPVGVAWVVVQVPHLVFHLAHDEGLPRGDWVFQAAGLAGMVLVAAAVAYGARGRSAPHVDSS